MKFFILLSLLCLPLLAQKKKPNLKHLEPFKWDNPLPTKFEKIGVQHGTFESAANKTTIGYNILLPKAYPAEPSRRFPVVYLLHGGRPGSEAKLLNLAPFVKEAIAQKTIPPTIAERKGRVLEGYSQGGRGTLRTAFRYPELFAAASAGSAGVATELKIQENKGAESEKTRFSQGDDVYTLAKQYAETKKATLPLKLLLYTGDGKKDFNWEGNVAYSTYLDFLKIPHRHLLISDCGHSTTQAYKISGKDLFSFLSPILQKASEGTN